MYTDTLAMRAVRLLSVTSPVRLLDTGALYQQSLFHYRGWQWSSRRVSARVMHPTGVRWSSSTNQTRARRLFKQQKHFRPLTSADYRPSASPPLLSTDIATLCTRCAADFTLPPPPPFPILSPPLPPRSARFVADLLFTPLALRPWPAYTSSIHCPLLVDQANLLLALAHLTPSPKRKRRLRHVARVVYDEQKATMDVHRLSALEVKARQAIDSAVRGAGGRLTPLPGWTQQEVVAVRAVRGERGRQHLRWPHPRFTHHQLKMVDVIERHRARVHSNEQARQQEQRQQQRAAREGVKAWKIERAERGYVSPSKWRVPGHLRWLMWKRSQARLAEASNAQQQQQQDSSGTKPTVHGG